MNREEAIKFAECLKHNYTIDFDDISDFCDEVIKALEQETCEDAVSRKDIYFKLTDGAYPNETIEQFIDRLVKELKILPSVTPVSCIATIKFSKEDMQELVNEKMKDIMAERKKGKWIDIDKTHSKCDKCESVFEIASANGESNYCPNCGAEMESEE